MSGRRLISGVRKWMGGISIYSYEEERQMAMKSKNSELDLLKLKQL